MAKKQISKSKNFKDGKKFDKSFRSKDVAPKGEQTDIRVSDVKSNDVSWYVGVSNPALTQAANAWFSNRVGQELKLAAHTGLSIDSDSVGVNLPGLMVLHYEPGFGLSKNKSSAINIAAQDVYSWVRHFNSGSRNYFAPDLMVYILAIQEIYACIADCARIFGLINKYSTENAYYPRSIVEGLGVDYDDLVENKVNYMSRLNTLIAKVQSFNIPNVYNWVKKQIFFNSTVFKDNSTDKGQLYAYVREHVFMFSATEGEGSSLVAHPDPWFVGDGYYSMGSRLNIIRDLIDAIFTDEDAGIMSGDINKAYPNQLFVVDYVNDDITTDFIEDYEVLEQINNTTIVGSIPTKIAGKHNLALIQKDASWLHFDPHIVMTGADRISGGSIETVLNTLDVSPSVEKVITATRNTVYTSSVSTTDTSSEYQIVTCESIIVIKATVYTLESGELQTMVYNSNYISLNVIAELLGQRAKVTNFNFHPLMRYYTMVGDDAIRLYGYIGNIANYTALTTEMVTSLNDAVVQNLFAVGELQRMSKSK